MSDLFLIPRSIVKFMDEMIGLGYQIVSFDWSMS